MPKVKDPRPGSNSPIPYAWTAIPTNMLCDADIPDKLVGFLNRLVVYARPNEGRYSIWPKVATLAKHFKCSVTTVSNKMAECEKRGLIERTRRMGRSSVTYLTFLDSYKANEARPQEVCSTTNNDGLLAEEDNQKKITKDPDPSKEESSLDVSTDSTELQSTETEDPQPQPDSDSAPRFSLLWERWRRASLETDWIYHASDEIPGGMHRMYLRAWKAGVDANLVPNPLSEEFWDDIIDETIRTAEGVKKRMGIKSILAISGEIPKAFDILERSKPVERELDSWEVDYSKSPKQGYEDYL